MAFCPNCGKEALANAAFCPSCGSNLSTLPPPSPQTSTNSAGNRPRLGFYATLAGGVLIFLSAIGYLIVGNPVAGVLGIVFAILAVAFGRRAYLARDTKDKINGMIPMVMGFIVMGADGALLSFDLVVLLGGFLMATGGAFITSGK